MFQRLALRQFLSVCKDVQCVKYAHKFKDTFTSKRQLEDSRRKLWVGFPKGVKIQEPKLWALSKDIKSVYVHDGGFKQCAFLTFDSERKAEENYIKLNKNGMEGYNMEVQFIGMKRYEARRSCRLIYYFKDPATTEEEIKALSEDIIHVHYRPNRVGRSLAFLDFENKEVTKKNLEKLLAMDLDVMYPNSRRLQPEDHRRALFVHFTEIGITHKDVEDLSPDIIKHELRRSSKGINTANIVFETEEIMEKNRKALRERGMFVGYIGSRRDEDRRENDSKRIKIILEGDVSMDEVERHLSDVVDVQVMHSPLAISFALIQFATEDLADENLLKLQQMDYNASKCFFEEKKESHRRDTWKAVDLLEEKCRERCLPEPVIDLVTIIRDEFNTRQYLAQVTIGDKTYTPETGAATMKLARAEAAMLALEDLANNS